MEFYLTSKKQGIKMKNLILSIALFSSIIACTSSCKNAVGNESQAAEDTLAYVNDFNLIKDAIVKNGEDATTNFMQIHIWRMGKVEMEGASLFVLSHFKANGDTTEYLSITHGYNNGNNVIDPSRPRTNYQIDAAGSLRSNEGSYANALEDYNKLVEFLTGKDTVLPKVNVL